MLFQTRRLRQAAAFQVITVEERLIQARACLDWFGKILADQSTYGFYNPVRHQEPILDALFFPLLCNPAAGALANIPTPEAQKALLALASQNTEILEHRKQAAAAFDLHVKHHRVLLTRDEIRQQYDLYNKNIGGLQEEVDILGGLLDSIETPVAPAASDEPSDE